ncbi:MAG: radical SAM protein [Candidatus Hydrogenedentota bacterium]
MKIVLAQSHKSWRFSVNPLVFPNGMLYCAAALEQAGFEAAIVDPLPYDLSLEQTVSAIRQQSPDIVGVYFTTDSRFRGFELVKALKNNLKIPVMAGGPHPTLCPKNTMRHLPELDIIIQGEAEYSMVKIAEAIKNGEKDFSNIPNVCCRVNNKIIINTKRYYIPDLDTIPNPAYHLIPDFKVYNYVHTYNGEKRPAMNVFGGRGCPFGCIFCASTHFWQGKVRFRKIENIMEQIKLLNKQYGIKHIGFFDETFNLKKGRILEFCDAIMKSGFDITWDCEIRADDVDREMLKTMKESRCTYVCFGIESADDYIRNKVIGKKISDEKIIEVDRICYELGLTSEVNLMVSFPDEDYKMADKTFKLVTKLKSKCHIQPTRIYPGTDLEKIAKERRIIPKDFDWGDPMAHKKYGPFYLPGILGDYPLYLEKLSVPYIAERLFSITQSGRWGMDKEKLTLFVMLKRYLSEINHYRDLIMLFLMGIGFIKYKVKNILPRNIPDDEVTKTKL